MRELLHQSLSDLTGPQIEFIIQETNVTREELFEMGEDELYDIVYDRKCDIETAETPLKSDEPLSDRCKLASDIVTVMENAIALEQGLMDKDVFFEE